MGPLNALGFVLLIAGTPLTFLLAPVMWACTAAFAVFGPPDLAVVGGETGELIAAIDLVAGNLLMILLNVIAAVRDRGWRSVPYAVLNPLYWVLHSWAAWRALVQLVRNPFLWEKTPHGLTHAPAPA